MVQFLRIYIDGILKKTEVVLLERGQKSDTFLNLYFKFENDPNIELKEIFLNGVSCNNQNFIMEVNILRNVEICFDRQRFSSPPTIEKYATQAAALSTTLTNSIKSQKLLSEEDEMNSDFFSFDSNHETHPYVFQFGLKQYDCKIDYFCGAGGLFHDILERSAQSLFGVKNFRMSFLIRSVLY